MNEIINSITNAPVPGIVDNYSPQPQPEYADIIRQALRLNIPPNGDLSPQKRYALTHAVALLDSYPEVKSFIPESGRSYTPPLQSFGYRVWGGRLISNEKTGSPSFRPPQTRYPQGDELEIAVEAFFNEEEFVISAQVTIQPPGQFMNNVGWVSARILDLNYNGENKWRLAAEWPMDGVSGDLVIEPLTPGNNYRVVLFRYTPPFLYAECLEWITSNCGNALDALLRTSGLLSGYNAAVSSMDKLVLLLAALGRSNRAVYSPVLVEPATTKTFTSTPTPQTPTPSIDPQLLLNDGDELLLNSGEPLLLN